MILLDLINHNKLSLIRNSYYSKNTVSKVITVTGQVFLFLYLLAIGSFTDNIIKQLFQTTNSLSIINSYIIYILLVDLVLRSIIQNKIKSVAQSYYLLPIKKRTLIYSSIIRSFFNFFNIYILFIIVPYGIASGQSPLFVFYIIGIYLLFATNQLLINIINLLSNYFYILKLLPFLFLFLLILLDQLNYISIDPNFFNNINILTLLKLFVWIFILLITNYILLKKQIRTNAQTSNTRGLLKVSNLNFLNNKGFVIELLKLEFKLLIRNKRTRQVLYSSMIFMFYFIFLLLKTNPPFTIQLILFVGIAGMFSLSYGQFFISWESSYIDFIMIHKIELKDYLKTKFFFLILFQAVTCLAILPLLLELRLNIILFLISLFYVISIFNFLILINSVYSCNKINLKQTTFSNFNDYGIYNVLLILLMFLIPLVLVFILKYILSDVQILYFFIILSLISLSFFNKWMSLVMDKFRVRKYIIIKNLKNK